MNSKLMAGLTRIIISKPDIIQFAKDRKYEEAWIIPINNNKPTDKVIDNYLNKQKFEILIVEYIWNSHEDDKRFVLTLFLDKKCQLQDPKKFIDINLNIFYDYTDFNNFIEKIDSEIIGRSYMFQNQPESINLSVFNHWLSVGPVELWQDGEKYNFDQVKKKIKSRPEIEKTKLNYQGLLFRFNLKGILDGPVYGLKTPCCDKRGDYWIVNYEKIDHWIKTILL